MIYLYKNEFFDKIIFNPPYLPTRDKEELDKNKGKSIEKTLMKLNLHFYDNVLYVNEPEL